MKKDSFKTFSYSALQIFFSIIIIIFLAQLAVVFIIVPFLLNFDTYTTLTTDYFITAILALPFLWLFIVLPLRNAAKEWAETFDSIDDAISIYSSSLKILNVNDSMCKMLGKQKKELIGKKYNEVFENRYSNIIDESLLEKVKVSKQKEYIEVFDAPTNTWLAMTVLPVLNDSNKVVKVIHVEQDITIRKQREQLKDDFVSIVSHELRTPLVIVREGISQVLEGIHGVINEKQTHLLTRTLDNVDRLTRMINTLLDISRIEAGKVVLKREMNNIVNVAKTVVSNFEPLLKKKGIDIKEEFSHDNIEIYIDNDRIMQVFNNLISNSFKFTEKGFIKLKIVDKDNIVECSISDTGKGIPPKDLPRVFSKFEQFDRTYGPGEKGTGLGLAICKGFVELHKGKIYVESKITEGTKFTFTLPRFTLDELFKEYITHSIKDAMQNTPLSVIMFYIKNFYNIKEKFGEEKVSSLTYSLDQLVKDMLRRKADLTLKDHRNILVFLPATKKEDAVMVHKKINDIFDDFFNKEELYNQVEVNSKVVCFPEDANTEEEFLAKLHEIVEN